MVRDVPAEPAGDQTWETDIKTETICVKGIRLET